MAEILLYLSKWSGLTNVIFDVLFPTQCHEMSSEPTAYSCNEQMITCVPLSH